MEPMYDAHDAVHGALRCGSTPERFTRCRWRCSFRPHRPPRSARMTGDGQLRVPGYYSVLPAHLSMFECGPSLATG